MDFKIILAQDQHIAQITSIVNDEAKCSAATVSLTEEPLHRWLEAYQNNKAPHIKLKSTNIKALEKIDLDNLKEYALDIS